MTGKVDEVNRHFELWRSKGILVEDLHYIQGEQNPADILTRGNVNQNSYSWVQLGKLYQSFSEETEQIGLYPEILLVESFLGQRHWLSVLL